MMARLQIDPFYSVAQFVYVPNSTKVQSPQVCKTHAHRYASHLLCFACFWLARWSIPSVGRRRIVLLCAQVGVSVTFLFAGQYAVAARVTLFIQRCVVGSHTCFDTCLFCTSIGTTAGRLNGLFVPVDIMMLALSRATTPSPRTSKSIMGVALAICWRRARSAQCSVGFTLVAVKLSLLYSMLYSAAVVA